MTIGVGSTFQCFSVKTPKRRPIARWVPARGGILAEVGAIRASADAVPGRAEEIDLPAKIVLTGRETLPAGTEETSEKFVGDCKFEKTSTLTLEPSNIPVLLKTSKKGYTEIKVPTAQSDNYLKEVIALRQVIEKAYLPEDLKERAEGMIARLERQAQHGQYSTEYERTAQYIDWIVKLPWNKRSEDTLELKHAKEVLNQHHYGLEEIKDRILEYLAVLQLRQEKLKETGEEASVLKFMRAPILLFVGLVGTGKTTIAYAIAEAMGRQFARIPLGGMGDPLDLRGQSRQRPDAEPGLIIKALRRAGTKNPVILLDEIDRVTTEGLASVMGVLVELLDPEQNMAFRDHFLDYPFDLSEVMFIATCNNTTNISTAVMDRLEPIRMPSYTDEEKITIAQRYILPKLLKEAGLPENAITIDKEVWPRVVRPLGFDAGVRTLGRNVNRMVRKIAKMIVEGDRQARFNVTTENMKEYLPTW